MNSTSASREKLLHQRALIISSLESIEGDLKNLGIEVPQNKGIIENISIENRNCVNKKDESFNHQLSHRIENISFENRNCVNQKDESFNHQLSHRGKALAVEIYERFAEKIGDCNEKKLSLRSFKNYLRAIRRSDELNNAAYNVESWMSYFHKNRALDEEGFMTKAGFAQYRNTIESIYPLENDLRKLGMHFLPSYLVVWNKMFHVFEAITRTSLANKKEQNPISRPILHEMTLEAGAITPECLQHIMAHNREFYGIEHLIEMMKNHERHLTIMSQLKKSLDPRWKLYNSSNEDGNMDDSNIKKGNRFFVAWTMSNRYKPVIPSIQKFCILIKTSMIRFLENAITTIKKIRGTINDIFSHNEVASTEFSKLKENSFTHDAKVTLNYTDEKVCEAKRQRRSSSIALINFHKIGYSNQILREMGMTRGAGTTFILDFSFRDDSSKIERECVQKNLEILFQAHLNNPLQFAPFFQTWKIFQRSKLLRIGLSWKRPTALDLVFRDLNLDVTLNDLLSHLKVDVIVSPSLECIFSDCNLNIEKDCSLRLSSTVSFALDFFLIVSTEILKKVKKRFAVRTDTKRKILENRRRWSKRTQSSHPHNPYIAEYLPNQSEPGENYQTQYSNFSLTDHLKKVSDILDGFRNMRDKYEYYDISFKTINDLLNLDSIRNLIGYENINEVMDMCARTGSVARYWTSYAEKMQKELSTMFMCCNERKEQSNERKSFKASSKSTSEVKNREKSAEYDKNELSDLYQKLLSHGIKVDPILFKLNKQKNINQTKKDLLENKLQSILAYSLVKKHVKDIRRIKVLNGKSILDVDLKNMGIIDILPNISNGH